MSLPSWYRVLTLLRPDRRISGAELGERLSLTRAAIWKQIDQLRELGVDVHAERGTGYRLGRPLELLDLDVLADTEVLIQVDSTNDYLRRARKNAPPKSGYAVLAEHQTAGRGRRGRAWYSPLASNVCASVYWQFAEGFAALSGFPVAVAVSLAEAFDPSGDAIEIKWPNDLYYRRAKLGGILLDLHGEMEGPSDVIVGVGINVSMPRPMHIDRPWTDLNAALGRPVSRNDAARKTVAAIRAACQKFSDCGLEGFVDAYNNRDMLRNQWISWQEGSVRREGEAAGVSATGGLVVRTDQGDRVLSAGEVTVSW